MKTHWKMFAAVVLIGAGAAVTTLSPKTRAQVIKVWHEIEKATASHAEPPPDKSWMEQKKSSGTWDKTVALTEPEIRAIGLQMKPVLGQADPTVLSLFGTTDYDPATVTTVRLQFDSRVDEVLIDLGAVVKKGQDLLKLYSIDLAAAKSDYELAISQYNRDKKVLDYKRPLAASDAIAKKDLIEAENDEQQSKLKKKLARDKLLVYGLTEQEIEAAREEDGQEKARMTVRARADGVVVKRDVVQGNYYNAQDPNPLLTIAPLDHLWVRGGVSELDADKVTLGQKVKVIFPFADAGNEIPSTIAYIDKAIDPDTRAAKFRTTIPNPNNRYKAGAFVKVEVYVPPRDGRTVIPRSAMVSVDRMDFVFIRRPGKTATFERRPITVFKESNDLVIVAEPTEGHRELKPGEEVATIGSLILEQMYEDRLMVEGGQLAAEVAQRSPRTIGREGIVIRTRP